MTRSGAGSSAKSCSSRSSPFLAIEATINARDNMHARGIPTDLAFWNMPAGFDINQSFVSYSALSTYGRAFLVGLFNTLFVAIVGVIFATIVGFALGAARLSKSWLLARLATIYVETIRNVPLLLQMLFWYNAVLKPLPGPRQSIGALRRVFRQQSRSLRSRAGGAQRL